MALTRVLSSLLTNTAVSSGTYGGASAIPVIAINSEGQITSASNATVSVANTQITGLVTASQIATVANTCLLYTSPSPRDGLLSRMPSSA